jgi:hypothetical protein
MDTPRRLGTAKQACAIARVSPSTLRNWLRQDLIGAVRAGRGRFWYDLDSVEAMRVEYGRTAEQRIREVAAAAPEFSDEQINKIRLLLHSAPSRGDAP